MQTAITLDISQPKQKYLKVSYAISEINQNELVLVFPVWAPGSYMIREYASQVDQVAFADTAGKKLKFEKIDKCRWRVATKGVKKVMLTYRVYAGDLNVRGAYADHEMIFINGSSAYFHIQNQLGLSPTLSIKTPFGWVLAHAKGASKVKFKNFDELYDTPVLCAKNLTLKKFKVGKTDFTMAFWGSAKTDLDKVAADVKKIIERQVAMFKGHPCAAYCFQVMFLPKMYGGLEHAHSSSNVFDGSLLADPKEYQKFLALLSHEHFHLWNIKRIRPKELGPFDYTTEAYTRELWLAEGVTSYYDDHFVWRAGHMTKEAFLDIIAENITKLEAGKATKVNSISDSSFDAWIKFYRQNENSLNTTVSYYLKGGLVVMLLDFFIITKTHGKKTLDDVMRLLFKMHLDRPGVGVTREEFLNGVAKVCGHSAGDFFHHYIDGTTMIDWKKEFSKFGITVSYEDDKKKHYLGVVLGEAGGRVTVQNIAEDSPAFDSELSPGDEIIAINGERFTSTKQLDAFLTGKKLTILFSRLGLVYETVVTPNGKPKDKYKLSLSKKSNRLMNVFLRTK